MAKIRQIFGETIQHLFNNPLVIPRLVWYNVLCNQSMTLRVCAQNRAYREETAVHLEVSV